MNAVSTTALTSGCGLGVMTRQSLGFVNATAASYQDHRYLELLNRALRGELNCLHAYTALSENSCCNLQSIVANHDHSIRDLSTLIIRNRGIPENQSGFSGELGKALIQLTSHMPEWIHGQAQRSTFMRSEKRLSALYEEVVALAPPRDKELVRVLNERIKKNVDDFFTLPSLEGPSP